MMAFSLWKKLKNRLRRGRKPMWALGCAAALFCLYSAAGQAQAALQADGVLPSPETESVIELLTDSDNLITVKLRKIYLCGEETAPLGRMTAHQALSKLREHSDWTAIREGRETIVMEQRIDDLSAACKQNAYFGLDESGHLSLYDGPPKEKKVLRTFFQLDVHYLESSLPPDRVDELVNGIRIQDRDEYNSVLSTFSDYAVGKTEKVMHQTY